MLGDEAAMNDHHEARDTRSSDDKPPRGGTRPLGLWMMALAVLVFIPARAEGDGGDDNVPSGTIVYMSGAGGACPPGWVPATLLTGRLAVGVSDGQRGNKKVGAPLADMEDRPHQHAFSTMVKLPPRNIAGANGGNLSAAADGTYAAMGTTTSSTAGLPFIQLLACEKP